MHRCDILKKASDLTGLDREETYGHPFESMSSFADMTSSYLRSKYGGTMLDDRTFALTAEDMCHILQLLKMIRTFGPEFNIDNYLDNAAYGAMAGECRAIAESDDLGYPQRSIK